MANSKQFEVPDVGLISVHKRATSRSVKISIDAYGAIKVSIPKWLPYDAGLQAALRQRQWIEKHTIDKSPLELTQGARIGKAHQLNFAVNGEANTIKTRLNNNLVQITLPPSVNPNSPQAQKAAKQAAIKALRKEAENLLPQRLSALAAHYGFTYASVSVRQLKTRWGSCDVRRHITLNIFLMQLPWELIDYVLVHELAHTEELNHSAAFWEIVGQCLPTHKQLRKQLRANRPLMQ